MNDLTNDIKQQIHSCETLMNVFQKERSLLSSRTNLTNEDIKPIITLKQRLMQTFQNQHQIISNIQNKPAASEEAAQERRLLLSKLGRKLEQLLVIDRENEILLRKILSPQTKQSPDLMIGSLRENMPARINITNRVYGGPSSRLSKRITNHENVSIRAFNPERLTVTH